MQKVCHTCDDIEKKAQKKVVFFEIKISKNDTTTYSLSNWYVIHYVNNANISFTGKERDAETGYYYHGARYYDPVTVTGWTTVDPMMDKYPGISPYAYCAWNPVKIVDPDGRELGDYYDMTGKYLFNDGLKDGKIYVESREGSINYQYSGDILKFRELGTIDRISLTFTGKIEPNSERAKGKLNIIQEVGDAKFERASFDALSGSRKLYPLENGEYISDNFRKRTLTTMVKDGIGFSIDLAPLFETNRSNLRIHPDGGLPGTEGCIGLTGSAKQLTEFTEIIKPYYSDGMKINLNVNILLNANHNTQRK